VSHDFIEFVFPCTDCLVAAACRDRKQIKKLDFLDYPSANGIRCLALQQYDTTSNSHEKALLESVANITWRIAGRLNEDRGMKIPEQYRHFLMEYLAVFQYILNTTSWNSNVNPVAEFDKFEIRNKMKTAMKMLDWIGDPLPKE